MHRCRKILYGRVRAAAAAATALTGRLQIAGPLGLAAAGLGRAAEAGRYGEQAVHLLPVTREAAEGPLYLYLLAQIHARLGQTR